MNNSKDLLASSSTKIVIFSENSTIINQKIKTKNRPLPHPGSPETNF